MPDAVRVTLKKIVTTEGKMSYDEAEKYLEEMDRTGRYQAETWS